MASSRCLKRRSQKVRDIKLIKICNLFAIRLSRDTKRLNVQLWSSTSKSPMPNIRQQCGLMQNDLESAGQILCNENRSNQMKLIVSTKIFLLFWSRRSPSKTMPKISNRSNHRKHEQFKKFRTKSRNNWKKNCWLFKLNAFHLNVFFFGRDWYASATDC